MVPPPEVQLMAVAAGLYLQDTVILLHANEGVLTQKGADRWRLGLGTSHARIMGKNLYLPNLLMVHRPHFRMAWDFESQARNPTAGWAPDRTRFATLGYVSVFLGLLQFLVLPLVLFTYLTDLALLLTIAAIYSGIVTGLYLVFRRRGLLGLTGKKFAGLCFECLVCPPLAINLVRRLSLDLCKHADLVGVAERCLDAEAMAQAKQQLVVRIEDQLSLEPLETPRYKALEARLQTLSTPEGKRADEHN